MSVERIYYDQIKSFEETLTLIKNQLKSSFSYHIKLSNIDQIISQHDFIHKELYHKFNTTKNMEGNPHE